MKLLTSRLLKQLPAYDEVRRDDNPMIYAKLFLLGTNFRYYVAGAETKSDGDVVLYGYGNGDFPAWIKLSLRKLESVTVTGLDAPTKAKKSVFPASFVVERALSFRRGRWNEVKKREGIKN